MSRLNCASALHDLRRMLRDTLHDQLRQLGHKQLLEHGFPNQVFSCRGGPPPPRTESWYASVGLARECIASLRLLDVLEVDSAMLAGMLSALVRA